MSAIFYAIANVAESGDNIIVANRSMEVQQINISHHQRGWD